MTITYIKSYHAELQYVNLPVYAGRETYQIVFIFKKSFYRKNVICMEVQLFNLLAFFRRRLHHVECTGSLSTSEVKQHRARLVLGWGTAWEDLRVLSAFPQVSCLQDGLCFDRC